MRLCLFRPAFSFPGWVSKPFWWESAPIKTFFFPGCFDGNAWMLKWRWHNESQSFFAFSPQLVTIKIVSKDTKQIPSQAVTRSGQLFLFQIIVRQTIIWAYIWAYIKPLLNTVLAWQVNLTILWKIIIFHLTKEVLNALRLNSALQLLHSFLLIWGSQSNHFRVIHGSTLKAMTL